MRTIPSRVRIKILNSLYGPAFLLYSTRNGITLDLPGQTLQIIGDLTEVLGGPGKNKKARVFDVDG